MGQIRAFTPDDAASVAELHGRCFGPHATFTAQALGDYFEEIFFRNPWYNERFPSLLYEDGGRIGAFIGVVPRPMELRGEPLQALVLSQFMADPTYCPALVPLQLVRSVFSGPQDLVLTDGANEAARKVWVGGGGMAIPLYDFHWECSLRPTRQLFRRVRRKGGAFGWAARIAEPAAHLLDPALLRLLKLIPPEQPEVRTDTLEVDLVLDEWSRIRKRFPLAPVYDQASLTWLVYQASHKEVFGKMRSQVVMTEHGDLCGWHISYRGKGPIVQTVQLYARPGHESRVLGHLLREALEDGALAVRGRCDPPFTTAIARARGRFTPEGPAALCQSRRPEILSALRGGDALFSRLEGEWWMRFVGG